MTRHIVVLHGFGGQGKTSLAIQAAEWFTRTHLFDRTAFVSFETGVSLELVLNELGNILVADNFQVYQGDKVEAIRKCLVANSVLVVFDNFESVLSSGNAPLSELQSLLNATAQWFDEGPSRLIITTRNPDIPHHAFTPGKNCLHKELEGLSPDDALEFSASIFDAYSLLRPPRASLEKLLEFLKCHPLSLQLAIPQLRHYSVEQLIEQYQTILPAVKMGSAEQRNESLALSLRFSLDRIGQDALKWLSRLSVFEGGAMENALILITEIPEEIWGTLKPQLASTALIRIEEIAGVNVPFVHFHPTLAPFLRAERASFPSSEGKDKDVESRYWHVYHLLMSQLYKDDAQHPLQVRAIVWRELPNAKRALKQALAGEAIDAAVSLAVSISRFLDIFGRWRERDEISAEIERGTSTLAKKDAKISEHECILEIGRGERLLQQGRAIEAEKIFRRLLKELDENTQYDSSFEQTTSLAYIGRCLHVQGRHAEAANFYQNAIRLASELKQDGNSLKQIAAYHADLANVMIDSGQYSEARKEYEISRNLFLEINDNRNVAVIDGQLGTLALKLGNLEESRQHHLESQVLFHRMGEDQMEAISLHMLGMVAQEMGNADEAESYYKQSLTINERMDNWVQAAATCNQLAILTQNQQRPEEAERWCRRAIDWGEKSNLTGELGKWYSNLANLLLARDRLDDANFYAHRAIDIKEQLDLPSEPWKTYSVLAQIAEKRGRMDEARDWQRKELESFAAFAGSDLQIKQFEALIILIVQASRGDRKARAYLEGEYPKMQQAGEFWQKVCKSIQSMVDGERNRELLIDGLPRTHALIIIRALQALSDEDGPQITEGGPTPGMSQNVQPQQEQGITLPQLLELIETAVAGDQELGQQLFLATQKMAHDSNAEIRALGNVLLRVLIHDFDLNLDGLPDEVASAIRGMLGRIKTREIPSS